MNTSFITVRASAASTAAAAFTAAAALAMFSPATAHAQFAGDFTSPGGNVYCTMSVYYDDSASVYCEGGGPYDAPKPECAVHSAWGDRFTLTQGQAPVAQCHNDTIRSGPLPPPLDYGQTQSVNTITCASEPSGITCTDASTGHFITMSASGNTTG